MQHISEAQTHTYSRVKYVCNDNKIKEIHIFKKGKNYMGLVE